MMDIKKHEYAQTEYEEFLRYVESTWRNFLEWGDWKEEVAIEKIIVGGHKNFEVFVYLKGNPVYYDLEDGKLIEVTYDGKPIKTTYSLSFEEIVYVLLKGTLIEDLGLTDVELIVSEYTDFIEVNTDLTKWMEDEEQSYAETMYCIEHDL